MVSRSFVCSIILLSATSSTMAMLPSIRSQASRLAPQIKQMRSFSTQKPNDQEPETIVVLGASLLGGTAGFVGGCMASNLIDDGHYRNSKELDQMVRTTCGIVTVSTLLGAYQGTNPAFIGTKLPLRLRLLVTAAASSPWLINLVGAL